MLLKNPSTYHKRHHSRLFLKRRADIRWRRGLKSVAQKSLCTWHLAVRTSRSVKKADLSQPTTPVDVICCLLPRVDRCSHSFCTPRQCSMTLRNSLHLLLPLSHHTCVCTKTCIVQTARAGPCKDAFCVESHKLAWPGALLLLHFLPSRERPLENSPLLHIVSFCLDCLLFRVSTPDQGTSAALGKYG